MTFFDFGSWWVWPISGDYEVVALDPDYRWSLVGHPSRDYAWILAREPRWTTRTLLDAARPAAAKPATIRAG